MVGCGPLVGEEAGGLTLSCSEGDKESQRNFQQEKDLGKSNPAIRHRAWVLCHAVFQAPDVTEQSSGFE